MTEEHSIGYQEGYQDGWNAAVEAQPQQAPVQEPENHFKSACWLRTSFSIGRYLMSNAHGRWNGTEKALYHRELCKFYVAAVRGFDDEGLVDLCGEDFKAVHKSTQQLTDRMDEVIGFPLDSAPDYAKLEPLFFEHFHTLAMHALQVSQQPAPVQEQQPAPASKPVLLQCLGCERVGTQEQLSQSVDCDCWLHTQPAPVQEPTRFDLDMDGSMMPSESGRWVRYEDI